MLCRSSTSTFAYEKLPQQNFNLSVIRLNGSCFDVEVGVMATVAELKQAVEDVFSHSPHNRQPYISWYRSKFDQDSAFYGQKLNDDKEHIRYLGIRDHDKLYFARNLAINYKQDHRQMKDGSSGIHKQIYTRMLEGNQF